MDYKHLIPDGIFLRMKYKKKIGRKLNLKNPQTYNEKLQWIKLHDRNPLYTTMVDKYEVKKYVANIIGDEYIIPLLGVWNSFKEIDFDELPNQFVLKCTHDSGGTVICKDKNHFDRMAAEKKINYSLSQNYFWEGREWPYKNVKPRIIAEKYMEDHIDGELRDYKFFCFDGVPRALFIATDRGIGETKFDYFDLDFNHLNIKQHYPNAKDVRKPVTFDEMVELSQILSAGMLHVRVDFYEADGRLYFGEFTFYSWGGFEPFLPSEWDSKFGEWLKLPI